MKWEGLCISYQHHSQALTEYQLYTWKLKQQRHSPFSRAVVQVQSLNRECSAASGNLLEHHSRSASLMAQMVKDPPANAAYAGLIREDPLEKEMATHFSILAWEIPWTEDAGGPQSMGSQRVRHNLATKQHPRSVKSETGEGPISLSQLAFQVILHLKFKNCPRGVSSIMGEK